MLVYMIWVHHGHNKSVSRCASFPGHFRKRANVVEVGRPGTKPVPAAAIFGLD